MPFVAGDDGGRMVLEVRRQDSAASAAARFCAEQAAGQAACSTIMENLARQGLRDHGFHWQAQDSPPAAGAGAESGGMSQLAHRPRLQWLRQNAGCPTRVVDVGACFGAWTRLLREVCPWAPDAGSPPHRRHFVQNVSFGDKNPKLAAYFLNDTIP
jgi:hypothetical protein